MRTSILAAAILIATSITALAQPPQQKAAPRTDPCALFSKADIKDAAGLGFGELLVRATWSNPWAGERRVIPLFEHLPGEDRTITLDRAIFAYGTTRVRADMAGRGGFCRAVQCARADRRPQ
jgi:hypothetical protein